MPRTLVHGGVLLFLVSTWMLTVAQVTPIMADRPAEAKPTVSAALLKNLMRGGIL